MEKITKVERCIGCDSPIWGQGHVCTKCREESYRSMRNKKQPYVHRSPPSIFDGVPGGDIIKDLLGDDFL